MTPSPFKTGPLRISIICSGRQLIDECSVTSVSVSRQINKIPTAKIVLIDGHMPTGDFDISDKDYFKPGNEIEIKAGYGDEEDTIFKGIVIRHSMSITRSNSVSVNVECKDQVFKMTRVRYDVNHKDKLDSKILSDLFDDYHLKNKVEPTENKHAKLVQYNCTDWDFMLTRVEVNSLMVIVGIDTIEVKSLKNIDNESKLKVAYGRNLHKFNADIDAASQIAEIRAVCWDPKTQETIKVKGKKPKLKGQGNLGSNKPVTPIDSRTLVLKTPAALDKEALQAWADARFLRSELARIRGSMSFQGTALALPGEFIELENVGDRFKGKIFITGITHNFSDGDWTTDAQFGMPDKSFSRKSNVSAPAAGGLSPGASGLQIGIVTKLDEDPEKLDRIQVKIPTMGDQTHHVRARLANFYASDEFGAFFIPEIGDEVVLGYLNNDPAHPVILGSLYSPKNPPPEPPAAENNIKKIVTRSKLELEFEEEKKHILLKTPGGNEVILSDEDQGIKLTDQTGNTVELTPSGIRLDSPKDITLNATGNIKLSATQAVDIEATTDATVKGLNVTAEADIGLTAKGNATAELSAGGQTTVKGGMVMIN
jgi:Rhs element Vgr protein